MNERQWSKLYRDSMQARAGDPRLPGWLRVSLLAYGSHARNGHALFKPGSRVYPGDLAMTLARVDTGNGDMRPASAEAVRDAIDRAVEFGWIAPGSCPACLIVNGHDLTYDVGAYVPCRIDHARPSGKHHGQALKRGGFERAA